MFEIILLVFRIVQNLITLWVASNPTVLKVAEINSANLRLFDILSRALSMQTFKAKYVPLPYGRVRLLANVTAVRRTNLVQANITLALSGLTTKHSDNWRGDVVSLFGDSLFVCVNSLGITQPNGTWKNIYCFARARHKLYWTGAQQPAGQTSDQPSNQLEQPREE